MVIPVKCRWSQWLVVGLLILLLGFSVRAAGAGIAFQEFSIQPDSEQQKNTLLTNVRLSYQLNEYLREGLLNGMTLEGEIRFDLEWHNAWWWNASKSLDKVKTELKYHSLSQHYQLVRLDTNEHWNFPTLVSALEKMGTLKNYPLPALPANARHNDAAIFVSAKLKPQSLELPLQVQSLFSDRYSLESEGVMWPIP